MNQIKLSDSYTAGLFKKIGPFQVTRQWQMCSNDVVRIAKSYNGDNKNPIFLIKAAVSEKHAKVEKAKEIPLEKFPEEQRKPEYDRREKEKAKTKKVKLKTPSKKKKK